MTTPTGSSTSRAQGQRLLRTALLTNALFSTACAVTMLVAGSRLAAWLGLETPVVLTVVGAGLLVFAVDLTVAALRGPRPWTVIRFSVSDLAWVAGSVVLLVGWPGLLSAAGRLVVLDVALAVLAFAIWQLFALYRTVGRPLAGPAGLTRRDGVERPT